MDPTDEPVEGVWILPKQLHTSRFVADTKALGLDSEQFSQVSERSLTWRSKPSRLQTWLRRWNRESWLQRLSTRILRPSHSSSFVTKWTSYLEDSRASPLVLLENARALKTRDTSGHTSSKELQNADRDLFSWRTSKESSQVKQRVELPFCTMSLELWKFWVTKQRQEYSQRLKSGLPTAERESLYWPTASARDWKDTQGMSTERQGRSLGRIDQLPRAVYYYQNGLQDQSNDNTTGNNHELNPNWVEQLMGLPVGWTDLGSWETE